MLQTDFTLDKLSDVDIEHHQKQCASRMQMRSLANVIYQLSEKELFYQLQDFRWRRIIDFGRMNAVHGHTKSLFALDKLSDADIEHHQKQCASWMQKRSLANGFINYPKKSFSTSSQDFRWKGIIDLGRMNAVHAHTKSQAKHLPSNLLIRIVWNELPRCCSYNARQEVLVCLI